MSELDHTLKLVDEEIAKLRQKTMFCLSNYDYHHKNDEYKIIAELLLILQEAEEEGERFTRNISNLKNIIEKCRNKCAEANQLLKEFRAIRGNVTNEEKVIVNNDSFGGNDDCDQDDEANKENNS
uniref:Uncharacterized protein n=1 Tax=Glossina austeni TaxID=7395 RepID=A0A1A9UHR0_GLOAU